MDSQAVAALTLPRGRRRERGSNGHWRAMRLLEVFNHYQQPGGESVAALRIFDLLREQPDIEVSRMATSSHLWLQSGAPPKWKQALWTFSNPEFRSALRQAHAAAPADAWIVYNVFPVASAGVYAEALRLGVPVIQFLPNWRPYSINGSNFISDRIPRGPLRPHYWREVFSGSWRDSPAQTAWLGLVLSWLRRCGWLRSVRAWVAISDFARDRFIEAGLPRETTFALRYFWPLGPRPEPAPDSGAYLFLGRLVPEKGVASLLEAWRILRDRLGDKTPGLLICGSGPLEPLVRDAQVANPSVRFKGWVEGSERQRLLEGCRAMMVPSVWWEPLGLVVYEAYEACKPVVAAASGGLNETVVAGETGWLHSPGDAEDLARRVIALESDPQARRRMGIAGREWLERNADPNAWLASFRNIVDHAMSIPNTPHRDSRAAGHHGRK